MPDMATLKKFALLDPSADDAVLKLCMDAAIEWYRGGDVPNEATGPQWDMAVYFLATWYHENRGAIGDTAAPLPQVVFGFLNGLRYKTWPVATTPETTPAEGGTTA